MTDIRHRYRFGPRLRLGGRRAFALVYGARMRKNLGPISVCARPNGLDHPRLGLSVSRKVGSAVRRHRIKRLLREAFRLGRHSWPGAYDLVVIVHPHELVALEDYQRLLAEAVEAVHGEWKMRERHEGG